MKRPSPRQLALFGALGLSLAATLWVSRDDEADTAAVARPRHAISATPTPASAMADWPGPAASARADWPALDPQARAAWGETPLAPPPAQAEAAPPPPSAPPFPYQFVGRMTDSRPRAVLNNAQRSAVVAAGDVVDGQWRVDAIEAGGLRLTYLPLGLAQFVSFARPSA
ncbi:hypothetical protein [Roseateles saccharophilus]|uniref:Uncharacterized protein n=1 Tax=Roseateles saccharophilus TaxID=304 RepID=A0A4R3UYW8_ROSSA|nr:hypothetical protein [Roseateles saccharophilus]MDG0833072.1 hypothetical protein [Roseateles saccharophilus]TCU96271.1 hypothetical protein EV671_101338 [Roseateles saccharophilus]